MDFDLQPTRKILALPDRTRVLKGGADDFENTDKPRYSSQVAKQIVARFDLLGRFPSVFTETCDLSTGVKKLLPGGPGKKVKPIAPVTHIKDATTTWFLFLCKVDFSTGKGLTQMGR